MGLKQNNTYLYDNEVLIQYKKYRNWLGSQIHQNYFLTNIQYK